MPHHDEGTFHEISSPSKIAAGADGNLWFTEPDGNRIGRITPAGAVTEFAIPTADSEPAGIAAGPEGLLWFTERKGNKIGSINLLGEFVAEFPIPTAESVPWGITPGPDGNLWFTESSGNKIGRITPAGEITEFPLPTLEGGPRGITTGPDGNLWFTEYNAIGRLDLHDGLNTISEFPVGEINTEPSSITTGPDGNLWFTRSGPISGIGRVTPAGEITEYSGIVSSPSGNSPNEIVLGPDGYLWFTDGSAGALGRMATSGELREFLTTDENSEPDGIVAHGDALWFAERKARKIGCIRARVVIDNDGEVGPFAGAEAS